MILQQQLLRRGNFIKRFIFTNTTNTTTTNNANNNTNIPVNKEKAMWSRDQQVNIGAQATIDCLNKHTSSSPFKMIPVREEFCRTLPLKSDELEKIGVQLGFHRNPVNLSDRIALRTVRSLRWIADNYFKYRYLHRFIFLETVAAVPGMVGGMLNHLQSLRIMKAESGWIQRLLHEAENERMHLMIWMGITKPSLFERVLVTLLQGGFCNIFFLLYLTSPRTAHRLVGYLEEEAVISYTHFLQEIDSGKIDNIPATPISKEYWNLASDARLRDMVLACRADEAAHRDVNHHFADRIDLSNRDLSKPLIIKK